MKNKCMFLSSLKHNCQKSNSFCVSVSIGIYLAYTIEKMEFFLVFSILCVRINDTSCPFPVIFTFTH